MTDEEKRIRYKNIVYRLRIINNKIEDLDNSISSLKEAVKKSITIDDEGLKEDNLKDINKSFDSASSNIRGNIIPSLNNKIYS